MGNRIDLSEIDEQIRASGHASVTIMESGKLVSFIECGDEDLTKVREILEDNLPEYYIPQEMMAVHAFPHLQSGKIDVKALVEEKNRRTNNGYKR